MTEPKGGTVLKRSIFFSPSILKEELGEIERTAKIFKSEDAKGFMKKFIERAEKGNLVDLTEDIWAKLENTDSYDIPVGGFEVVQHNAEQVGREWKSKKKALENEVLMPAPIVLKFGERYHKVAGNTRLMLARAMGGTPKVLIVDMTD